MQRSIDSNFSDDHQTALHSHSKPKRPRDQPSPEISQAKKARREKNRINAAYSRKRKRLELKALHDLVHTLHQAINEQNDKMQALEEKISTLEAEKASLKAEMSEYEITTYNPAIQCYSRATKVGINIPPHLFFTPELTPESSEPMEDLHAMLATPEASDFENQSESISLFPDDMGFGFSY